MSLKYGFPVKDDTVTKMFEAGIGADKIPEDLIKPYLLQDLKNTLGIAEYQIKMVVDMGMMDLVISQMEALHCVTEMMYNGMNVDYLYFAKYAGEVATEYADVQVKLAKDIKAVPYRYYPLEDLASATQWSKLLFGGSSKVVEKEAAGFYKNGKPKFKSVTKNLAYPAFSTIAPFDEWKSEKTGKVSVDEEVLKHISMFDSIPQVRDLVQQLLLYREVTKQLTTYIQGLGKHVISTKEGNNYIYGRLQQVTTATGRLSSSSPNLQNISNNPIKKIFKSRFLGGQLVEFDFSQLEVAILAHVSKDRQLL
jgi:DNA polymerase I-like protein with 3'-5' exonuclease and polymerase domains